MTKSYSSPAYDLRPYLPAGHSSAQLLPWNNLDDDDVELPVPEQVVKDVWRAFCMLSLLQDMTRTIWLLLFLWQKLGVRSSLPLCVDQLLLKMHEGSSQSGYVVSSPRWRSQSGRVLRLLRLFDRCRNLLCRRL